LRVDVTTAVGADLAELAGVAARTFPLACPPSVTRENIRMFIDENLSEERLRGYLADPARILLAAREDGRMVGYAILIRGLPDDEDVRNAVTLRPTVELSKMYVLPDSHGAGVSAALMSEALGRATAMDARSVWLGVNQLNKRAQRFYAKHGFAVNGVKTFRLGAGIENDYVMVRPLP
jgi:ribosomal protein S18 acetylase RimI-like enzyme